MAGEGGTEAYPDLGRHCQHADCGQLDFLPFKCAGCRLFFCLDHRSYGAHHCPMSDVNSRKVLVCEVCSASVDVTGLSDERAALQKHERSGTCDPSKKKKALKCPVKRCREVLTFSNSATCKHCDVKVCLKHRFEPADHACKRLPSSSAPAAPTSVKIGNKFLEAFAARNGKDCGNKERGSSKKSPPPRTYIKVN